MTMMTGHVLLVHYVPVFISNILKIYLFVSCVWELNIDDSLVDIRPYETLFSFIWYTLELYIVE